MIDWNTLKEQFDRLIDKPLDYNALLTKILQESNAQVTVVLIDGVPMIVDNIRGKTLSVARPVVQATLFGQNMSQRYLKIGEVPTQSSQGFILPRAATITGLWAKSRSLGNWTIEVRKNGLPVSLVGLAITGGQGLDPEVDFDLDAGDTLQVFANGASMSHIIAGVELAWRAT